MAWVGAVAGLVGTLYASNQAKKNANNLANATRDAGRLKPTSTGYGSSLGYRYGPAQYVSGGGYTTRGGTKMGSSGYWKPGGAEEQFVNIDPRIRGLREETLGRIPGYRGTLGTASQGYLGQLGEMSEEMKSNNNPFIQARVNPLIARQSQARGNLQQDLGRRNIGLGTTFGANSLGNFESITGREVADQTALATQEALAARMGLDAQTFNVVQQTIQGFQGMDAQEQAIAAANLSQELVSLGLSQQDASAAIAAAGLQNQGNMNAQNILGRGLYGAGQFDWGSLQGKNSGGTSNTLSDQGYANSLKTFG
jgi:hypothetical protein